MQKILDYYIVKRFLSIFFITIFCFLIIFILVDIIDHLDNFIERNLTSKEIITYYTLTIPLIFSITFPMSLLISTILTFASLQKNNEITSIKASGISIRRIGIPLLFLGILFCFISFYFDNTIVTSSLHKRYNIDKKLNPFSKKFSKNRKNNIYYHLDGEFLEIRKFNYKNNTGYIASLQKYNNHDLINRIDAKKIIWDSEEQAWNLINCSIRNWENNIMTFYEKSDTIVFIKDVSPEIIKKDFVKPEEMDYWELSLFIDKLKNKGLKYSRWSVNKHYKTAFACIPFIMILFGFALSIQKSRSNYALGIGLSLIVIFAYYVLIRIGQSLGYNGIISPFFSVWTVNFIFLFFGGILFFRART